MQGRMLTAATAGVAIATVLALAPAAAFGQTAPGGSFTATDTTGPDAPLTLGTGSDAQPSTGGGSGSFLIDESEPLAETGGGALALGLGGFLIASGGSLHLYATRRSR